MPWSRYALTGYLLTAGCADSAVSTNHHQSTGSRGHASSSSGPPDGAGGNGGGGSASSSGGGDVATSSSTGLPACERMPPGASTSCAPYGPVANPVPTCATPPLYLYACSDHGAPATFSDCYQFERNGLTYCEHDACTQADPVGCAEDYPATPREWICSGDDASTLPPDCVGPFLNGVIWCCATN